MSESTAVAVSTPSTEGTIVDTTYSIKADGYIPTTADPGFRYGQTVTGTFEGRITGRNLSRSWDGKAARDYTLNVDSIAADGEPGVPEDGITPDAVIVSIDGRFELPVDPAYAYGQPLSGTFVARVDGENLRADIDKVRKIYRLTVTELVGEGIDASFTRPESVTDAADAALDKLDQLAKAVIRVPAPTVETGNRAVRAYRRFRKTPVGSVVVPTMTFLGLWVGTVLTLRAVVVLLG